MAVQYYLHDTSTAAVPNDSAASTFNIGYNAVSGPLDQIILRQDLTVTAGAHTDVSSYVRACRIIIDGEVCFDFRAGFQSTTVGSFAWTLNSVGGRAYSMPTDATSTAIESYWAIPIGKNLGGNGTVPRVEITLEYFTATLTIASGSLQFWHRYNDQATSSVRLLSPQSYNHSANSLEQVNLKTSPQVAGVIDAIVVQNDTQADEIGSQGIRLMSQSQFAMPIDFHRFVNGDLGNGIMYDSGANADHQRFAVELAGGLIIPTFGLVTDGDLTLFVDSSATTTRTYHLLKIAPFGAGTKGVEKQTASTKTNVQEKVLSGSRNA